ncbi:MAG: AAA domain-containing protein, partial [Planctomycetaceae bacterium]
MSKFSPVGVLAAYPIEVSFPQANVGAVADVREAIGLEYCDSIRVKRLNCRGVTQSSLMDSGGIFELQTGQAVDFDWTWEGAAACRPRDPDSYEKSSSLNGDVRGEATGEVVWAGEVLEVDEASGKIFVKVDGDQPPPTTGSFFVRPFEFLSVLHSIYHSADCRVLQEMLPGRLQAACGGVHPRTLSASSAGLPQFKNWWQHQWSVLWGPPGTGKTHTIGQQLADVLSDPGERVLVVSTTNNATDSSAVAIGRAAHLLIPDLLNSGRLLRIGKGASLKRFARERLNSMLRGTETDFLHQIEALSTRLATKSTASEKARIRGELSDLRKSMRDAGTRRFLDHEVRLIVATAFRATSLILLPQVLEMLLSGKTPFTTVVVDEAGLISRAAVAVLSLLASRRVVLVGDARQLAPISRMCRLLPPAQMKWLSSSGLSHLQSLDSFEAGIHVLKCQYRMHPDVCRVVSGFQYDGLLQTAVQRQSSASRVPTILA